MKVYGNPTYSGSSHDKLTNDTILEDIYPPMELI